MIPTIAAHHDFVVGVLGHWAIHHGHLVIGHPNPNTLPALRRGVCFCLTFTWTF